MEIKEYIKDIKKSKELVIAKQEAIKSYKKMLQKGKVKPIIMLFSFGSSLLSLPFIIKNYNTFYSQVDVDKNVYMNGEISYSNEVDYHNNESLNDYIICYDDLNFNDKGFFEVDVKLMGIESIYENSPEIFIKATLDNNINLLSGMLYDRTSKITTNYLLDDEYAVANTLVYIDSFITDEEFEIVQQGNAARNLIFIPLLFIGAMLIDVWVDVYLIDGGLFFDRKKIKKKLKSSEKDLKGVVLNILKQTDDIMEYINSIDLNSLTEEERKLVNSVINELESVNNTNGNYKRVR